MSKRGTKPGHLKRSVRALVEAFMRLEAKFEEDKAQVMRQAEEKGISAAALADLVRFRRAVIDQERNEERMLDHHLANASLAQGVKKTEPDCLAGAPKPEPQGKAEGASPSQVPAPSATPDNSEMIVVRNLAAPEEDIGNVPPFLDRRPVSADRY